MSPSHLEANLALFRKRFSDQGLRSVDPTDTLRFSAEQSHSGDSLLVCEDERGQKRPLQSRVNPRAEAEKNVKESVALDDSLSVVCVVGFEMGYTTEILQDRLPSSTAILIWEPLRGAFQKTLETRCLRSILEDDRVLIYVDDSPVKAAQVFEIFLNPVIVRNWSLVVSRGTHQFAPDRVSNFYKELYSLTSARKLLYDTTLKHSHTFIKNAFLNLCRSEKALTVESLRDTNKDRPAIVVSAGPSLTQAIPTLREVASKCTVVAVGAAWKTLINAGIRPDYVVLLDPFERTRSEFEGVEPAGETLIADFSGFPDVVSNFKGPIAFYCSSPELHGVMNAVTNRNWGHLEQGGSVAHIAFSFARLLGVRPIVLIGQDLAFTGGLTHVGTHVDSQQVSGRFSPKHGPLHEIEAFGGEGTVLTSRSLDTFRIWFESVAKEGVLNATGGGARIRGIPEIEFADLRERIKDFDERPDPRVKRTEGLRTRTRTISDELRTLERKTQAAIKDIDKALKLLDRMRTAPPSTQNSLKIQFNALTKKLSSLGPGLNGILDYLARQQIFQTNRAYNSSPNTSGDEQVKMNLEFYRGLRDSCTGAIELLGSARASMPKTNRG